MSDGTISQPWYEWPSGLSHVRGRTQFWLYDCTSDSCSIGYEGSSSGGIHDRVLFDLVSENKVLCHPSSVDSISTSAGQEDHVSMGGWSARKALKVIDNVEICSLMLSIVSSDNLLL